MYKEIERDNRKESWSSTHPRTKAEKEEQTVDEGRHHHIVPQQWSAKQK